MEYVKPSADEVRLYQLFNIRTIEHSIRFICNHYKDCNNSFKRNYSYSRPFQISNAFKIPIIAEQTNQMTGTVVLALSNRKKEATRCSLAVRVPKSLARESVFPTFLGKGLNFIIHTHLFFNRYLKFDFNACLSDNLVIRKSIVGLRKPGTGTVTL